MTMSQDRDYITITPTGAHVIVRAGDRIIAQSDRALSLAEGGYPIVYYIPREDAEWSLFTPTDHSTHCPHKGDAAYFSVEAGGETLENVAWSYEAPFDQVAAIKGHLAFYTSKVSLDVVEAP